MSSFNKVILIGNLTRDPELRHVQSGQAICALGLAVSKKYKTQAGEDREETCFVDVTVWGKPGENCAKYLKKGSKALIEGRLQFDQWDDRETGRKRSKLSVVAESVQFMDERQNTGVSGQNTGYQSQVQQPKAPTPPPMGASEAPGDSDLPF